MLSRLRLLAVVWLAMVGLFGALSDAARAEEGNWVLSDIRLHPFAGHPAPGPHDWRHEQDAQASGVAYTLFGTDADNVTHRMRLWMGWTFAGTGDLRIRPPGSALTVTVNAVHSGDYYNTAEFLVQAGDSPRVGPEGWQNATEMWPTWSFRSDPVLRITASNGEATGTAEIAFPGAAAPDSEPFTILFWTGLQGKAGVEYVYEWRPGAAPATPPVDLPPEVTGATAPLPDPGSPPAKPATGGTPPTPDTAAGDPPQPQDSALWLPPGEWTVQEGPWAGTWTLQPDGRTIAATWRNTETGAVASDTLRIEQRQGQLVIIARDSMNGQYVGAVSCDGTRIDGWATWYTPGMTWQAQLR